MSVAMDLDPKDMMREYDFVCSHPDVILMMDHGSGQWLYSPSTREEYPSDEKAWRAYFEWKSKFDPSSPLMASHGALT